QKAFFPVFKILQVLWGPPLKKSRDFKDANLSVWVRFDQGLNGEARIIFPVQTQIPVDLIANRFLEKLRRSKIITSRRSIFVLTIRRKASLFPNLDDSFPFQAGVSIFHRAEIVGMKSTIGNQAALAARGSHKALK